MACKGVGSTDILAWAKTRPDQQYFSSAEVLANDCLCRLRQVADIRRTDVWLVITMKDDVCSTYTIDRLGRPYRLQGCPQYSPPP